MGCLHKIIRFLILVPHAVNLHLIPIVLPYNPFVGSEFSIYSNMSRSRTRNDLYNAEEMCFLQKTTQTN